MLSLAWPWMLLALPLPFLVRALLPEANQLQEAGLRVPSFAGFDVLSDRSRVEQLLNWRIWVAMVAWVLLVVAAARPERVGDELEVPVSGRNLMLAVDLSGSMDQKDFELGNRRVDRLTATKAVASDFISRREGDRIGLILFGERAYLQVPLTLDRETVKILLMEAFIGSISPAVLAPSVSSTSTCSPASSSWSWMRFTASVIASPIAVFSPASPMNASMSSIFTVSRSSVSGTCR